VASVNRRLGIDVLRYLPALVIPILSGTLSTIVFARIMPAEELGQFILVSALSTSIGNPCSHWLRQAVLRFYPAYAQEGRQRGYLRTITTLGLLAGGLASLVIVGMLAAGLGGNEFQFLYLLPAAAMTFFAVANTARSAILQAAFAVGWYSLLVSGFAIARLALPLLLFPVLGGVPALLWGNAVVAILSWIAVSIATWQRTQAENNQPVKPVRLTTAFKQAASFGGPLTISEIGTQMLDYSDRYAIAALLGSAAIGLYSTNYSIAEKLIVLAQGPLIYASHSQIIGHWERGERTTAERLVATSSRWLLLVGMPLVAFTVVRSGMVSAFLLGDAYADGHWVIPITSIAVLIWATSQYGHKSFELANDTMVITGALLAAAAVNVVAVILLTITMGYLGGAIATLIGYGTYAVLIFVASRYRGAYRWDPPWRTVFTSLFASATAALAWTVCVPDRITGTWDFVTAIAGGIVGLSLYVLMVVLLGELPRPTDSRRLTQSFARLRRRFLFLTR
jgi:O-antigen/teichoic acid export membrane protein